MKTSPIRQPPFSTVEAEIGQNPESRVCSTFQPPFAIHLEKDHRSCECQTKRMQSRPDPCLFQPLPTSSNNLSPFNSCATWYSPLNTPTRPQSRPSSFCKAPKASPSTKKRRNPHRKEKTSFPRPRRTGQSVHIRYQILVISALL